MNDPAVHLALDFADNKAFMTDSSRNALRIMAKGRKHAVTEGHWLTLWWLSECPKGAVLLGAADPKHNHKGTRRNKASIAGA